MGKVRLTLYFLLLGAATQPAGAANRKIKAIKPTATPTFTATLTATQTPTPTATVTATIPSEKLYAFDALWGSKGTGPDQLNAPEGVAVADDGRIYIADTGNNRVLIWDSNGKPLQSIGSFGTLANWRDAPQFNHPSAILVLPSKKMFVADTLNHRIVALDEKGLVISSWGKQGTDKGEFNLPRTIAKDHFGHLWVLDNGNSRLQVFSQLGAFISAWGSFGSDPGLLNLPLGMAMNNIDQTVLADTGNFRVQVFNSDGTPVTFEGWFGEGPYQFKEPGGVALLKSGDIAVTDGPTGRVEFFNGRFEYKGQWRAKDEILSKNFSPRFRGIASDDSGRLYVTDTQDNALLRLRPLGSYSLPGVKSTPTPPPDANPYGGTGYPIR